MTKIKTAQAWMIRTERNDTGNAHSDVSWWFNKPAVAVTISGLTQAQIELDIRTGLDLLAKSRDVCEWAKSATDPNSEAADYAPMYCLTESMWNYPTYCPSCGRKVVVK